jgi:hypothetical protein
MFVETESWPTVSVGDTVGVTNNTQRIFVSQQHIHISTLHHIDIRFNPEMLHQTYQLGYVVASPFRFNLNADNCQMSSIVRCL